MKKQGFTLIELMVVVVIIGILAAVAVPKLFGMIAKSKASEVGPAAGTYVKLQQAYVSEAATAFGNWNIIGYKAPGDNGNTTNFAFTEGSISFSNGTAELTDANQIAWQAQNKAKLNDCAPAVNWTVAVAKSADAAGEAKFTPALANKDNCLALTPSFETLGK